MSTVMRTKRNSMPSLGLGFNKFFVSKRASMFETQEETPQEKRDRSPCGILEVSERKLQARKDQERRKAAMARRKMRADPYADQSSAAEDDSTAALDGKGGSKNSSGKECRLCRHASAAVNSNLVRKTTKPPIRIGLCSGCISAKKQSTQEEQSGSNSGSVVWLCLYCGHQGCDRNSREHAIQHFRTPRSDPHCLILSTQEWFVWCYVCDCLVVLTSSKKLHEVVQMVKRRYEMACPSPPPDSSTAGTAALAVAHSLSPLNTGRSRSVVRALSPSNATTRQRGSSATLLEENTKDHVAVQPGVKGISNLGNTCFFNSVLQVLGQTQLLTQLFSAQLQAGQRTSLPGHPEGMIERQKNHERRAKSADPLVEEPDEEIELKPLELLLPEGGSLSLALASFLKDMHTVGRSSTLSPGHLFGQVCKKSSQFSAFDQQDAHELLRCLLESVRAEELSRAKRAILKAFALSEKTDPAKVAPHVRKIIQGYGRQATHTVIDQIFGGQLISTVVCEECHWSSQVFEPFMDLSLSITEDKGKPKDMSGGDDGVFDCFGRAVSSSARSGGLSKYQQKKQKKLSKKNARTSKYSNKGRGGGKAGKGGIGGSTMKVGDDEGDELRKRLTEKSRPEDEEFRRKQREEQEERVRQQASRVPLNGVPSIVVGSNAVNESSRYKVLVQERTARRKVESANGESSDEEDEELEYDHDDDIEDDGTLNKKSCSSRSLNKLGLSGNKSDNDSLREKALNNKNVLLSRLSALTAPNKTTSTTPVAMNGRKESEEDEEEEEEEEEEDEDEEDDEDESDDEDDDDDDESESDDKNGESDRASSSKKKGSSAEDSDADEEDNAESEFPERITRQPSIIVVEQTEDYDGGADPAATDSRYLCTSASCDHLNYNSASDTSERYFTADGNGVDTGDDLDTPRRRSHSRDSLLRAGTDDELVCKLGDLKAIQRKSSSSSSLHRLHLKRPSAETLHSFRSCDRLTEEEDQLQPCVNPRKFREEWLARSLMTLAPKYQARTQECSIMSCLAKFTTPELLANNNKIICQNCTKLRSIGGSSAGGATVVRSPASKQLMIVCPPAVLTIQLKRFHHDGLHLAKANRYVHFPLVLDLAPFTSTIAMTVGSRVLYGLYGVVQHTGRLHNGHYTAYVRSRPIASACNPPTTYLAQPPFDSARLETDPPPRLSPGPAKTNTFSPTAEELETEVCRGAWYHISDSHVSQVSVERVLKAQAYLLFYERLV